MTDLSPPERESSTRDALEQGEQPEPRPEVSDGERVERLGEAYVQLRNELHKIIVGQEDVIEEMMIALCAGGHSILIGLPGLAKTLLVNTLARLLSLTFKRVQFTPDLMPSDITGTDILQDDPETGTRGFRFLKGPLFTNLLLADEINRTPPKTQAALLEAMQEHHVTAGERTMPLPEPFFVVATQNPIEQEGTYQLPEAQLDRFLLSIRVSYPDEDDELEIMKRTTPPGEVELAKVLGRQDILDIQSLVPRVPAADHVFRYALKLVRSTRPTNDQAPQFVKECVSWGAGPRAAQNLMLAAKARAILHGKYHVSVNDIDAVASPVLSHRVVCNFHAGATGIDSDQIIRRLREEIRSSLPEE